MLNPEDVVRHLAKGKAHWQEGYSAHALATTWFKHNGLPPTVRALLDSHDRFRSVELVDAVLERQTDLGDGIRGPSQTDLLAILGLGRELAVAAIEGKVDESFGPLVSNWLSAAKASKSSNAESTRERRLNGLKRLFGVEGREVGALRYQLFHRMASAIHEAKRYRASVALLIVHSFSTKLSGWSDFAAFVEAIDMDVKPSRGRILGPKLIADVETYAAWVKDELPTDLT
jgi:hypothetical protein